jgi:hypothetical protein
MDIRILFVTTFNEDMYKKSGFDLITSFLKNTDMNLLVCYEGFDFIKQSKIDNIYDERLIIHNIMDDPYLKLWTKNNMDIIPSIFGGNAPDDHPIFIEDKLKGQYWARYRTAGYFRKIASLNYSLQMYSNEYDIICVIDSDCIIKNPFTSQYITSAFDDGQSMFFYWGKYRKKINRGPETGFTGYCKKNNGYVFANLICKSFITQDFKRFEYWDDGYVIGQLINENCDKFKFKDLVGNSKDRTTRVMENPNNIFYNFVHHFKNRHGKLYDHIDQFKA